MSSGDHHLDNLARTLTVREDVRGAAWNYLALLDRHRVEFHADKCPERGDFPRWYRDKAASQARVDSALERLRDALAVTALAAAETCVVVDCDRPQWAEWSTCQTHTPGASG